MAQLRMRGCGCLVALAALFPIGCARRTETSAQAVSVPESNVESASKKHLAQASELLKVLDKPLNSTMPRAIYYGLHKKLPALMPEALDVLIQKLESPNWDTRWDAEKLLIELGGAEHRDRIGLPLLKLLADDNLHVRSSCFYGLCKIKETRALGILIEMAAVPKAVKFSAEHIDEMLCELSGLRRAPRSWRDWWRENSARYLQIPHEWQEAVESVRER